MTNIADARATAVQSAAEVPGPGLGYVAVTIGSVVAVLAVGLLGFSAPLPLMMLVGYLVAIPFVLARKVRYEVIESTSFDMIRRGLHPMLLLVTVGALIPAWIMSGTVPALLYDGLHTLSPEWFLPATVLVTVIVSLATGTNFGTIATVGIALLGVGTAMGIPAPITVGAITCGATFGEKMCPLSNTTVMAAGLSGARLMAHVRHMMWTTIPAITISTIILAMQGWGYHLNTAGITQINHLSGTLTHAFHLGWIPLIPPVLVFVLLACRMPAFPSAAFGAFAGAVIAVTYQGQSLKSVLTAMWKGYTPPASLGPVSKLLTGGDTGSALGMLGIAAIVLFALGMTGVFAAGGIFQALIDVLTTRLDTPRKLVPATLVLTFFFNIIGAAVNFAVAMGATLMRPLYERQGLALENLSRATEDCGTTTGPIIPWNATAVFTVGALGVGVGAYMPYAYFCFLTPLFSLLYAVTGFTIKKNSPTKPATAPAAVAG